MRRSLWTSSRWRGASAFTLIELLTVVAIIGVLAAILWPVLGIVRQRADGTRCLAQLAGIGPAIAAYGNDHDDSLPGPLNFKQGADYDAETTGSLARLLENYLPSESAPGGRGRRSPLLLCPAAARRANDLANPTYLVNMLELPFSHQPAWGDEARSQQPLSRAALAKWSEATLDGRPLNLADLWAIRDADQEYLKQTSFGGGSVGDLPPLPAHDDYRNALFFDFHVARTRLLSLHVPQEPKEPVSESAKD